MVFHNPYHFVPVLPGNRQNDLAEADFRARTSPHVRHDVYAADTRSGRITCRLVCEEPLFVGAGIVLEPTREEPGRLRPFERGGRPAIPASSLRGMISSIVEAATNSALRVLHDASYSFRKNLHAGDKALSAIGMIVLENGALKLRPLTMPHVEYPEGAADPFAQDPHDARYKNLFPRLGETGRFNWKVYIGDQRTIAPADYPRRTWMPRGPHNCYYYVKLADGLHRKGQVVVAAEADLTDGIKAEAEWQALSEEERGQYTRGIVRTLGVWDRGDIPLYRPPTATARERHGKKHEVFIPLPSEVENAPTIPIPQGVIDRFRTLCDERTEARKEGPPLPYHPADTDRLPPIAERGDEELTSRHFRLKHGDLVYFEPDSFGSSVAEIALASIWRGRVESRDSRGLPVKAHSAHEFFFGVDRDLLPYRTQTDSRRKRTVITEAEQLFGFVEERPRGSLETREVAALAGRLFFSDADLRQVGDQDYSGWTPGAPGLPAPYLDEVTLRILDSPKPPSPSFYFKHANPRTSGALRKALIKPAVGNQGQLPQGRKFYLHAFRGQGAPAEPWKHVEQRDWPSYSQQWRVTPVRQRAVFEFTIDFFNLTERELNMLLYALRPNRDFRHKLGMGKPIGLGTVRIDVGPVQLIDRARRYSWDGLFALGRIHETLSQQDVETRIEQFRNAMPAGIRGALDLLGKRSGHPVHSPASEPYAEEKTYEWFVSNEKQEHPQGLTPLDRLAADQRSLPTLQGEFPDPR